MEADLTEAELHEWRSIAQLLTVLPSRLERGILAGAGLSIADYTVLSALSEASAEVLRPYELGLLLGWEKSRLHHHLTRMGKRGLVHRGPDPDRSRAVLVTLTAKGRSVLRQAAPTHVQDVRELVVDVLAPEQYAQLAAISRTLLTHLASSGTDQP